MELKKGIPVSPGIAIGEAFLLDHENYRIAKRFIRPDEVEGELRRLEKALDSALEELEGELEEVSRTLPESVFEILRSHRMFLTDPTIRQAITDRIEKYKFTAEYATSRAFRKYIKTMRQLPSAYHAQRDADMADAENRILRHLVGEKGEQIDSLAKEVILICKSLRPSHAVKLDSSKILGVVTESGGETSHAALITKDRRIPAVFGAGPIATDLAGGDHVIVDGTRGSVILNPDPKTVETYKERARHFLEFERSLESLVDLPAETLDGHEIKLLANIERPEEIPNAIRAGAEGIGLYRSEFLYSDSDPDPSEETHFQAYREAIRHVDGRPLTIRTLDLGADKGSYGLVEAEANPFLGLRSIRLCFQKTEIFHRQLRALLRASALSPHLKIMLPMISSLQELRDAKAFIHSVMEDLERERIEFNPDVEIGIMIEVPSAALIADVLAREVQFFSIGTNDLIQYVLAVDRENENVAPLYQPAHPSVLRLVQKVLEAGRRHHIPVSMCGDMAGRVKYTIPLIGMGLREFSIIPAQIPEIKKVIRDVLAEDAQAIAEEILQNNTSLDTERRLEQLAKEIIPWRFG